MPSAVNSEINAPEPKLSLKEKTYLQLKAMIVEGKLEPGAFLSERQLGRELNVSGSPVRAALERLGIEGFVHVSPQRGTIVRDLSLQEIRDQFELRHVIESYTAECLAGQLTSEQVGELEEQLRRQKDAAHAQPADALLNVELDIEFHLLLSEFLGNQEMQSALHRIHDRMKQVILKVNQGNDGRLPKSYGEHRRIAKAIIEGDASRAAKEMKNHLAYGRDRLLKHRHSP